jgi:hypothetical protein
MKVRTRIPCLVFLAAMMVPVVAGARTATTSERTACEARIQPRIDAINSKLRAGYTVQEGERLKNQRRKLAEQLANCRKVP